MLQVRPIVSASKNVKIPTLRRISSAASRVTPADPPFPIVPTCPSPTCACAETPAGLDIERVKDLNGSMAPYSQQVLISTGKSDWSSRIEDGGAGTPWGDFGRQLKAMLGRGGKYSDPYNNVMTTYSSFADNGDRTSLRVLLFPSFRSISIPEVSNKVAEDFVQEFLLPETLHPMHQALSAAQKAILTRRSPTTENPSAFESNVGVMSPVILICGHKSRDRRCGVMGPLLQAEFARQLEKLRYAPSTQRFVQVLNQDHEKVNVGLISHIGGHKWAANVIMYVPPNWTEKGEPQTKTPKMERRSPLAGCGIWYGRVEPKHVEGILKETLLKGTVIRELFRGGIGPKSEVLRLPL